MERKMIAPKSFGTHDGPFHADEVTACSLLLLFDLIDRKQIVRTRDFNRLASCEYVCDVGGVYDPTLKRFDHHQNEYQGPMSSAGMVLAYLKEQGVISEELYYCFYKVLILGIDAHDNGVAKSEPGTTTFSQVVSNFLPIPYDVSQEMMQDAFSTAVDFVLGHLQRMMARFEYTQACRSEVEKAMQEGTKLLIFHRSIPWMESFFELGGEQHPAAFLIMPTKDHYKLRGIPPSLQQRMQVRRPLPESWAGLQGEALKEVTGISGAVFCHKGRFISIWETKDDALKAYRWIQENDI